MMICCYTIIRVIKTSKDLYYVNHYHCLFQAVTVNSMGSREAPRSTALQPPSDMVESLGSSET